MKINHSVTQSNTFDLGNTSRVYLDNGFLQVSGKAARTGLYKYIGDEIGLKTKKVVTVKRSENEVFKKASLDSYSNVDVTNDHPDEFVNAKNYKNHSVGHVISAKRDGDFVLVDMLIKDAQAIKDIENGKVNLSAGYSADYSKIDDQDADYEQKNIMINHVALVHKGRGGPQVKVNDKLAESLQMKNKVTLDSSTIVEVNDEATAILINNKIEELETESSELIKSLEVFDAENKRLVEELEAEKLKTSDEAINKLLSEIVDTQNIASEKLGEMFTCDAGNPTEVKRKALAKAKPNTDWSSKSDAFIDGAFEALEAKESKKEDDSEEDQQEQDKGDQKDKKQLSQDSQNLINNNDQEHKLSAYDQYKQDLSNQWKEGL